MKVFKFLIMTVMLSVTQLAHAENEEFSKKWSTSYSTANIQKLAVTNKFGKINVTTTDEKTISVSVKIQVNVTADSKAQKLLDNVQIKESIEGNVARIVTEINRGNVDNSELTIDYTISLPKNIAADFSNSFGDIVIGETNAEMKFNVNYGSLRASNLNNAVNDLKIAFGNGFVEQVKSAKIELSYGNLDIDRAGDIKIKSSFSNIDIDHVNRLDIDSQYDNLDIDEVATLIIDADFSNCEFGDVSGSIKAEISYGEFEVDEVKSTFTSVEIESQAGGVEVDMEAGTSYEFHCKSAMGNMELPNGAKITSKNIEMMSSEKSGVVGSNPNGKKVDIEVKQGNLELK